MTNNEAAFLLRSQKDNRERDEKWRLETCDYIKNLLGEHSIEYKFFLERTAQIKGIELSPLYKGLTKSELDYLFAIEDNEFIDSCCEKIMNEGLYEPPARPSWFAKILGKLRAPS